MSEIPLHTWCFYCAPVKGRRPVVVGSEGSHNGSELLLDRRDHHDAVGKGVRHVSGCRPLSSECGTYKTVKAMASRSQPLNSLKLSPPRSEAVSGFRTPP